MKSFFFLLGFAPVFGIASPAPLVIDVAQSRVEIMVKATIDSFTARLDVYHADLAVDNGRVTAATVSFRFSDIHTGKPGRDQVMHDWQDTPKHPDGVFKLTTLEPAGNERFSAHGTLTLHGVSKEIVFPVTVIGDRTLYAIDGEAPLDTREFGLPIIRKFGFLKVDPHVAVRFHLQGAVKAP